jgi:hypothetical protein
LPDKPPKNQRFGITEIIGILPIIVYVIVRSVINSDAISLAIAGCGPVFYSLYAGVKHRHYEPIALAMCFSFIGACILTLILHGNTLPLKLHSSVITLSLGLIAIVAGILDKPLPLKGIIPTSISKNYDRIISIIAGAFLVVNATVHFILAVTLNTKSFLIDSKICSWIIGITGLASIYIYIVIKQKTHKTN